MAHAPAHTLNELDPHGGTPHEHHVTSAFTLKLILGLLLFFTILTVGQAQAEEWIAHTFSITLPGWLNVAVVMAIATVKATLVLLYFMHLRHDNPINAVIFGFTVLGVAIFMFFTFLDIGNRGYIDQTKFGAVVKGGSGSGLDVQRAYPAYGGVSNTFKMPVFAGLSPYVGAVDSRILELQLKHAAKVHPEMLNAKRAELTAKPNDAVASLIENQARNGIKISIEQAVAKVAFDETFTKACELVAADVAKDMIAEFEYHLHHGKIPHPDVLKRLQEKLGPAAFATITEIAQAHELAEENPGLAGSDRMSSKNFSRAKKGQTSGLFEVAAPKPEAGHGGH
jgi:cytochrome c oxidase subunit 4